MQNSDELKHIIFLRNAQGVAHIWGGLEKLMLEWFERIDYSRCKVTLGIAKGWKDSFDENLRAKHIPVEVIALPFDLQKGSFPTRFLKLFFFLKKLRPSSIVFMQGQLFCFDFAHTLAGFLAASGDIYMHENLGPPIPPAKVSRRYFGFIPGIGMWWYIEKYSALLRAYISKKIVVVSKEIEERLISLWHYPPGKIVVQYHGVDLQQYRPSAEIRFKIRAALKISAEETVIIVTARLSQVKCIHRTIEAFDALSRQFPNLRLLIAGSGPLENELQGLAKSKPCAEKIMFLGHVRKASDYLKAADIHVMSSDNEGLSLAFLEALATGLVCVSTKCPGPNEILQDGINGFIVEKSTAGVLEGLKKTVQLSPPDRRVISQNAVEYIRKNFEINNRVHDTLECLGIPQVLKFKKGAGKL